MTKELGPGDTVGPYRIERLIGRGRMGVVYRASADGGGAVAIKVIHAHLLEEGVFGRRFQREIEAARRLAHPNVVETLDDGVVDGVPWLAQRYIPGGSLADRIGRDGPLSLAATLKIAHQVAAGLDALHVAGVVHRDVKPQNILLDEDGVTAYLSDFGLAKDSQSSELTRPGQALGSLDYMAPEQIRGEKVSPASDVYALGCTLWECLTGGPPFAGRPSMKILFAHLQESPGDLSARRTDIPAPAAKAIGRALEKRPEDRPPTASAYVSAIAVAGV